MKKEEIRKFMREKRELKVEIISPRGASCRLYAAPPGTRITEREREDAQVLAIKAFMERERFLTDEQDICFRV